MMNRYEYTRLGDRRHLLHGYRDEFLDGLRHGVHDRQEEREDREKLHHNTIPGRPHRDGGKWRCCLLCMYMPAIDRSLG